MLMMMMMMMIMVVELVPDGEDVVVGDAGIETTALLDVTRLAYVDVNAVQGKRTDPQVSWIALPSSIRYLPTARCQGRALRAIYQTLSFVAMIVL